MKDLSKVTAAEIQGNLLQCWGSVRGESARTQHPPFKTDWEITWGNQGHIPDLSLHWYLHQHLNVLTAFCHPRGTRLHSWKGVRRGRKMPRAFWVSAGAQKPAPRVDDLSVLCCAMPSLYQHRVQEAQPDLRLWTVSITFQLCNLLADYWTSLNSNFFLSVT